MLAVPPGERCDDARAWPPGRACRPTRYLGALGPMDRPTYPYVYWHLYRIQRGRCAMCGAWPPDRLDHDHQTLLIRGLLCGVCNDRAEGGGNRAVRYRASPPAAPYGWRYHWAVPTRH